MNAMDRLRRRIQELLDLRTHTGKLRQKRLAEHLNKSEAWLSNILEGRRGLRLNDLDEVAEFFRVPPSELVRTYDTELEEVTPSERTLLRRLRRAKPEDRDAIFRFAGLADGIESGHRATQQSASAIKKQKVNQQTKAAHIGTDSAESKQSEKTPKAPHPRRTPTDTSDDQSRLREGRRDRHTSGMETRTETPTAAAADEGFAGLGDIARILGPCED